MPATAAFETNEVGPSPSRNAPAVSGRPYGRRAPTKEAARPWRWAAPWRKSYRDREPRIQRCIEIIGAPYADFRQLVRAALETGCRYSELTKLEVQDFNPDANTVTIHKSKSGKAPRHPDARGG